MSDPVWMFIVGQLVTAAGVYAAIRADLAEMRVRVAALERWRDREEARA